MVRKRRVGMENAEKNRGEVGVELIFITPIIPRLKGKMRKKIGMKEKEVGREEEVEGEKG